MYQVHVSFRRELLPQDLVALSIKIVFKINPHRALIQTLEIIRLPETEESRRSELDTK